MDDATAKKLQACAVYAADHTVSLDEMKRRHEAFLAGRFTSDPNPATTVELPMGFKVVFTIEEHPMGWMRHMSMSSPKAGRAPIEPALAWVMGQLGYTLPVSECITYPEDIGSNHVAINVLEPIRTIAQQGHA